jgi:CubicO group peptidase (beta-lactamase class C family)
MIKSLDSTAVRVATTAVLMLFGMPAFADDRSQRVYLEQRLNTVVDTALAQQRIVGAVVMVLHDGHLVYHRAAGYLDREAQIPMSTGAIFRLASCSKAITSAAAMALVERGQLSLDDPVTKWLPEFRPAGPDGSTPKITIRELLTHTSGLSYPFWEATDGPYHRAGVSSGLDQPGLDMEEELRRLSIAGLLFAPGTQWRYSLSIDVLGAVIAKATHKPLPEAIRSLVTGPLHMSDTGFKVTDVHRLAVPYYDAGPKPKRMGQVQDVNFDGAGPLTFAPSRMFNVNSFPSGGAGMAGTAEDYARFLEAVRSGGGPILKRSTAQSMMENQVGDMKILSGPGWGFGFGAAVVTDAAAAGTPLAVGTWSWSGAYGNSWFVDPANRLTAVAFTDTAPEGDSGSFAMEVRNAVYGTP